MAIEAGGAPLAERLRPLLARRARGEEAAELATFARLLFARGGGYAEELAPRRRRRWSPRPSASSPRPGRSCACARARPTTRATDGMRQ
ncbi:MAG: hypothetical protein E6J57_07560 [Deltaproteobacteria bacterium]|nr:MAG: hypothetical protein E6J57_07560 [Deltaproteobacteria bacterium]